MLLDLGFDWERTGPVCLVWNNRFTNNVFFGDAWKKVPVLRFHNAVRIPTRVVCFGRGSGFFRSIARCTTAKARNDGKERLVCLCGTSGPDQN